MLSGVPLSPQCCSEYTVTRRKLPVPCGMWDLSSLIREMNLCPLRWKCRCFFKKTVSVIYILWSLLLCTGFLRLRWAGTTPRCGCTGFSLWWFLWSMWASVAAAHGHKSCGFQALERGLRYWWHMGSVAPLHVDLPGLDIKPVFPAQQGRLLLDLLDHQRSPNKGPVKAYLATLQEKSLWSCF